MNRYIDSDGARVEAETYAEAAQKLYPGRATKLMKVRNAVVAFVYDNAESVMISAEMKVIEKDETDI